MLCTPTVLCNNDSLKTERASSGSSNQGVLPKRFSYYKADTMTQWVLNQGTSRSH